MSFFSDLFFFPFFLQKKKKQNKKLSHTSKSSRSPTTSSDDLTSHVAPTRLTVTSGSPDSAASAENCASFWKSLTAVTETTTATAARMAAPSIHPGGSPEDADAATPAAAAAAVAAAAEAAAAEASEAAEEADEEEEEPPKPSSSASDAAPHAISTSTVGSDAAATASLHSGTGGLGGTALAPKWRLRRSSAAAEASGRPRVPEVPSAAASSATEPHLEDGRTERGASGVSSRETSSAGVTPKTEGEELEEEEEEDEGGGGGCGGGGKAPPPGLPLLFEEGGGDGTAGFFFAAVEDEAAALLLFSGATEETTPRGSLLRVHPPGAALRGKTRGRSGGGDGGRRARRGRTSADKANAVALAEGVRGIASGAIDENFISLFLVSPSSSLVRALLRSSNLLAHLREDCRYENRELGEAEALRGAFFSNPHPPPR